MLPSSPNDAAPTSTSQDGHGVRPVRLCIIVCIAGSLRAFYRGWITHLRQHGFDVTVVCAPSEFDDEIRALGVRLHTVMMSRSIVPWADMQVVWKLWRFLRRERFDLVEVGFPKSALVGALAAWLARTPLLIHILHGLAYEHRQDLVGQLLRWSTYVPCRLAHETIAVSPSVREQVCADGICRSDRIVVLGSGSFSGIDLSRFTPGVRDGGQAVRAQHGIARDAVVIGFVGRLNCEKGVVELVHAFRNLVASRPKAVLLLVGDYEHKQRPPDDVIEYIATSPQVWHVGWQDEPLPFYGAMDMLVLPSHREGLPTVLPEAAALGLPTIATDATGCRDAICPEVTGLQIPVGDVAALRAAMARLVDDPELRHRLGAAGRPWVAERFDQRRVWALYLAEYRRLIAVSRPERLSTPPT